MFSIPKNVLKPNTATPSKNNIINKGNMANSRGRILPTFREINPINTIVATNANIIIFFLFYYKIGVIQDHLVISKGKASLPEFSLYLFVSPRYNVASAVAPSI